MELETQIIKLLQIQKEASPAKEDEMGFSISGKR
jgi:hypothetical protein